MGRFAGEREANARTRKRTVERAAFAALLREQAEMCRTEREVRERCCREWKKVVSVWFSFESLKSD